MSGPEVGDAGRVALVTGAAGGLGSACCSALARLGMSVVASDLDRAAVGVVADELDAQGLRVSAAELDVCDEAAVDALVDDIEASRGRLDVLVNMAGVLRNARLVKLDDAGFHLTLDTHVLGTMHTVRAAGRVMAGDGYGRIVNASSVASRGAVGGASYAAAKGAIEALTRTAALELGPEGVTVNAVAPGMVDSGMFRSVPEEYQREKIAQIPIGRPATPEEVAVCVAFLAGADASYVTGQILPICGGTTIGI